MVPRQCVVGVYCCALVKTNLRVIESCLTSCRCDGFVKKNVCCGFLYVYCALKTQGYHESVDSVAGIVVPRCPL